MTIWGAEIPVTIVGRKPDFVGDDDRVLIFYGATACGDNMAEFIFWDSRITAIKLPADHPYYKKEKSMTDIVISREAAIEALRRNGYAVSEDAIARVITSSAYQDMSNLAKAIQELWDACPEKRPVDNRVIAMRAAYISLFSENDSRASIAAGKDDKDVVKMLSAFDAKLAGLEG